MQLRPLQAVIRNLRSSFVRCRARAFTDLLFDGKLDGLALKVHGPSGNLWLRESRAPMICIAGGSGLAPLISILQDAAVRSVGRPCVLLFGARTEADLYAQAEIAAIARTWNGAFTFVPVLSHEAAGSLWRGDRGLVTERIEAHAKALVGADAEAYLCGPPPPRGSMPRYRCWRRSGC